METKHAPAPWTISGSLDEGEMVSDSEGHFVCEVGAEYGEREAREFNARMIAASPDLLLACQASEQQLDAMPDPSLTFSDHKLVLKMLRETITKAIGEGGY